MIFVVTLCFAPSKMIEATCASFYATRNHDLPIKHVFVDQHYPLNKSENQAHIREIAKRLNIEVLDPGRNLGLHEGFNWAMAQKKMGSGDILICYDPDSMAATPGWDMALVRAIEGDPMRRVVWASLMNPRTEPDIHLKGYGQRRADGYIDLWIMRQAVMNSISAFDCGWLNQVKGFQEPRAFYGHLEAVMFNKLRVTDKDWAFLPGWREVEEYRDSHDWQFVLYKWVHSFFQSWPGDFETFLNAGCPLPPNVPKDHHLLHFVPQEHAKRYGYRNPTVP